MKYTDKANVDRKSFGNLVMFEFNFDEPQNYKDALRSTTLKVCFQSSFWAK
jgi:hypothetical protein